MLGSYLVRVVERNVEKGWVLLIHIELDLLDSQVNVLLDTEAEVAIVGEVLLPQLVLLHLEAPLQDLLGLYCQNQLCVWRKPVDFSCFV